MKITKDCYNGSFNEWFSDQYFEQEEDNEYAARSAWYNRTVLYKKFIKEIESSHNRDIEELNKIIEQSKKENKNLVEYNENLSSILKSYGQITRYIGQL